jgi:hypothetical protein
MRASVPDVGEDPDDRELIYLSVLFFIHPDKN